MTFHYINLRNMSQISSRATTLSTGWYKQINYSWNLIEISKIHSPSEFPQKWVPSSGAMIYFWRTAFCCSLSIFIWISSRIDTRRFTSLSDKNTSSCSKKITQVKQVAFFILIQKFNRPMKFWVLNFEILNLDNHLQTDGYLVKNRKD